MLIHPFAQARKKCLLDLVLDSSDIMVDDFCLNIAF